MAHHTRRNAASNKRARSLSISTDEDEVDVSVLPNQAVQQENLHQDFHLIQKAIESVLNPTDVSNILRQQSKITKSQSIILDKFLSYEAEIQGIKASMSEMSKQIAQIASHARDHSGQQGVSSNEISAATRQTYEDCISRWIRQALDLGDVFWHFDKRVNSPENEASVKAIYNFVKTQINHRVLSTRADQREQAQKHWGYFDRERIVLKIKNRFSNDSKKNREAPEAQVARLRLERRKQRRSKKKNDRAAFVAENASVKAALAAKYGSACFIALEAEEVQSDEESDAEDLSQPWRVYLPLCRMQHPRLKSFYDDLIKEMKEKRRADNERLGSKSVKTAHSRIDISGRQSSVSLGIKTMRNLNKSRLLDNDYEL